MVWQGCSGAPLPPASTASPARRRGEARARLTASTVQSHPFGFRRLRLRTKLGRFHLCAFRSFPTTKTCIHLNLLAELGLRSDDQALLVRRDRLTVFACAVLSVLLGVRFFFPARRLALSRYLFSAEVQVQASFLSHTNCPASRLLLKFLNHSLVFSPYRTSLKRKIPRPMSNLKKTTALTEEDRQYEVRRHDLRNTRPISPAVSRRPPATAAADPKPSGAAA